MGFKKEVCFDERCKESAIMTERYPQRVPIIVERRSSNICNIDKRKYMAPKSLTLGQFAFVVRKRLKLQKSEAMFLFINGKLITHMNDLGSTYNSEKDEDGFLYIFYDFENAFG